MFDFKLDYRPLLTLPYNILVYTIGSPVSPLAFNPLVEISRPLIERKIFKAEFIGFHDREYILREEGKGEEDAGFFPSGGRWCNGRGVIGRWPERRCRPERSRREAKAPAFQATLS